MKALLITNDSLKTEKYTTLEKTLIEVASKKGVELVRRTNAQFVDFSDVENYSFALFWDKDVRLAMQLEKCGLRLFNSAKSIALCDDKWLTHFELEKHNVPMPKSILAPLVWGNYDFERSDFVDSAIESLGLPIVVKHCFGSFGSQVFLAKDRLELIKLLNDSKRDATLLEEYISESSGKDLRIEVVGGKAVATMKRVNDNDFRANVTSGGKTFSFEPNDSQIKLAEECAKILGLDFCGVDIFLTEKPMVCEVNSNAHFVNLEKQTGIDVASMIIDHCLAKVNQ